LTLIFSERGRHGRLLTAIAHYPQYIGIGIDPLTAIEVYNRSFTVHGSGSVAIVDAAKMSFTDLAYKKRSEPFGMFDVAVHVLPRGYTYDLRSRLPAAPERAPAG
jgi:cyanophycinase